jgi:hypothetical protein
MKTIFTKEKDMSELDFSSGEEVTLVNEGCRSTLPHHCGGFKKGNNEENLKNYPKPTLIDSNKTINERKKKKKTRKSMLNKKFIHCRYCKKISHTIHNYWYVEACYFCGNKCYCEVSYCKKKALFHVPNCF